MLTHWMVLQEESPQLLSLSFLLLMAELHSGLLGGQEGLEVASQLILTLTSTVTALLICGQDLRGAQHPSRR